LAANFDGVRAYPQWFTEFFQEVRVILGIIADDDEDDDVAP
jgi:hypothetical protein